MYIFYYNRILLNLIIMIVFTDYSWMGIHNKLMAKRDETCGELLRAEDKSINCQECRICIKFMTELIVQLCVSANLT